MSGMVRGYIKEIEELRARLLETDSMYQQLKKASIQQQKARNRLGTYICKLLTTIIEKYCSII